MAHVEFRKRPCRHDEFSGPDPRVVVGVPFMSLKGELAGSRLDAGREWIL